VEDNSLHLIGINSRSRTGPTAPQIRLTDVIAVSISPPHCIGRRHPVAAIVEDETGEKRTALDPGVSALGEIAREPGLNGIPKLFVHDRLVSSPCSEDFRV